MSREEFKALLAIIDAKISMNNAHDSIDGGLIEYVRMNELIKEFVEKHVDKAE